MRKKRNPESDEQRSKRIEQEADKRKLDAAAEDEAIDAMVKRSIEGHGP